MFYSFRKFVATLLAIWLPLFSGNALASSIAMQMTGGNCRMVAGQTDQHPMHNEPSMHLHTQGAEPVANQDQPAETHEQQNSSCTNAGVCHFACVGYLATVAIEAKEDQPLAQTYTPFSSQFQSITSIPLDPPPLARV